MWFLFPCCRIFQPHQVVQSRGRKNRVVFFPTVVIASCVEFLSFVKFYRRASLVDVQKRTVVFLVPIPMDSTNR